MRKKIEIKIIHIELAMQDLEKKPMFYLKSEWKILHAQRQVLAEILQECPERIKKSK